MAPKDSGTIDLFQAARRAEPLEHDWPDPLRFPLNRDNVHVEDVILKDMRDSEAPLIVTGFASPDRLIDFVATAECCPQIRVVLGSEPFPFRRDTFSVRDYDLPREIIASSRSRVRCPRTKLRSYAARLRNSRCGAPSGC